jgi:hypothetical protein
MKLRKLAAQLGLEPACALVVAELWAGASKRKELRLSSICIILGRANTKL